MSITVEALYENGTLKLAQPLPLKEHEKVRVTVQKLTDWVTETSGLIRWTGDRETLQRLVMDPEFLPEEADADLYGDTFRNRYEAPKSNAQEQP